MFYPLNSYMDKFIKGYTSNNINPSTNLKYEDPTYLGFNLMIMFDSKDSPLFYEGTDSPSAIRYLENIGYSDKALMLKEMKKVLRRLTIEQPYYFQTVSGVKSLWSLDMSDPLRASESEIEFTTLESIDMIITYIIDLYRKACYDIHPSAFRTLLPRNLRHFRMILYISEMRKFHTLSSRGSDANYQNGTSPNSGSIINSDKQKYHLKELKDLISVLAWDLHRCEFNFNDSLNYLDELTNINMPSMASNSFKIRPAWIREQSTFKLFDTALDQYNDDNVINNPNNNLKTFEDLLNPSNNNFNRFVNKEFQSNNIIEQRRNNQNSNLDNIYGRSPLEQRLQQALNLSGISSGNNLGESISNIIQNSTFKDLGNVYDQNSIISNTQLNSILGNIFGSTI